MDSGPPEGKNSDVEQLHTTPADALESYTGQLHGGN